MSLRPPRPGEPGSQDWKDLADAIDQAGILGAGLSGQNATMPPLSSKEKQEAFRARNIMLGLTEVRGIYLPPEMHAQLRELARKMLAAAQKS